MDVFYAGSTSQPTCFFGSLATSVSSQRQEGILVRYLMHASNARIAPHHHHQSQSLPQPPPPTSVNSSSWLSTVAAACWTRTFIHRGLQSNQCLRLYSTQLIQRAVALALIHTLVTNATAPPFPLQVPTSTLPLGTSAPHSNPSCPTPVRLRSRGLRSTLLLSVS